MCVCVDEYMEHYVFIINNVFSLFFRFCCYVKKKNKKIVEYGAACAPLLFTLSLFQFDGHFQQSDETKANGTVTTTTMTKKKRDIYFFLSFTYF